MLGKESGPVPRTPPANQLFSSLKRTRSAAAAGRKSFIAMFFRLADLAIRAGCQLVVKLHPAESLAERQGFVFDTLSPAQRNVVRVVAGPLGDLLNDTWFGVTILSTVAVECAMQSIPCFLCSWLEFWPYGYIDQFTRFGVGIKLDRPTDLLEIPKLLASYKPDPAVVRNCSTPIESGRFAALLGRGSRATSTLL